MRRIRVCVQCAAAVVAALLAAGGCLPRSGQMPPPINVGQNLQAEYVVSPAAHPAGLAAAPDGRVFYTEKETGRIRVIKDNAPLDQPFAELPVNYAGDRGLLGIALHPDFSLNGRVYVFYTRSDTGVSTNDPQAVVDNRVVYFQAAGDTASGGEVFVASLPAGANTLRVGGRIGLDREGLLFVALGDLTDENSAQNNAFLVGKILRYKADGTIPAGNPIKDSPVFARGLRDPGGLTFDPDTGAPFVIDRNASGDQEINRVQKGSNYGWPDVTGPLSTAAELDFAALNPDYADPIVASGTNPVTWIGAAFNPSAKYGPNTFLGLFYGVQDDGRVLSLELSTARTAAVTTTRFAASLPTPITDLAFTPAGTLYVATQDAILRIVPFP